ncbi:MAG: nucleotidyltransferase domain-containing protein [Spirochaetes bacterium]|nr:nucleotidyltransferase domain-containing protein [Spirochaetota bacterium]
MDENIRTAILQKLHETENAYRVKIPLAIESGSRGWGFASANADYDCRFLYVRQKDWYLSVLERKEFIEYAVDEVFDIRGYDISRALKYIMNSNATIYEWISSNVVYIRDEPTLAKLQTLAADFFNPIPISYHYLNLAKKMFLEVNDADTAKIKKYFYILRPIANLNFIWQYRKMPYMEYDKTLAEIDIKPDVLSAIQELTERKMAAKEHDLIPRFEPLAGYFQEELAKFERQLKEMSHTKNKNYDSVDEVFRSIIEDVWK